jgi:hypothetical protein
MRYTARSRLVNVRRVSVVVTISSDSHLAIGAVSDDMPGAGAATFHEIKTGQPFRM